jgi:CMP-N-acetylneuraminic acid synthetase
LSDISRLNTVAVLPARGGSQRIPRKNIIELCGLPLMGWTIRAAQNSSFVGQGNVFVSTDDPEIASVGESLGATILWRPPELATNLAWTEPVIQHSVSMIEATGRTVDFVVWLNACVPQLKSTDIDTAAEMLFTYDLREVIAVDARGISNSAVRVLRRETLFQQRLSVRFAIVQLPYLDINSQEDLITVQTMMMEQEGNLPADTRDR